MMRKIVYIQVFISVLFFVSSCHKGEDTNDETIIKGEVSIYVDETLLPIIEDQVAVFENQYEASIHLIAKSELEIIRLLSLNKGQLAILTRDLTKKEDVVFRNKKIKTKTTIFGRDAIAFISHKSNRDTLIDLEKVITFVQGKNRKAFKKLIFDNANSSTIRHIKELAKVINLPDDQIFSLQTNNEVIDYVSKNEGSIGVVGVNWLSQPTPEMQKTIKNIKVLSVKGLNGSTYTKPTQDNIASGFYPLTRDFKMLNFQGGPGLGMGFASFVGGEIGQRIILKSGLVPVRIPSRNITIRKEINKK